MAGKKKVVKKKVGYEKIVAIVKEIQKLNTDIELSCDCDVLSDLNIKAAKADDLLCDLEDELKMYEGEREDRNEELSIAGEFLVDLQVRLDRVNATTSLVTKEEKSK